MYLKVQGWQKVAKHKLFKKYTSRSKVPKGLLLARICRQKCPDTCKMYCSKIRDAEGDWTGRLQREPVTHIGLQV